MMVKSYGARAIPNTGGEGRPLPQRDDSYRPMTQRPPKPTGLDWDSLTPKCKLCAKPSHQLDDSALCPDCGGVAKPTRWDRANRTDVEVAAPPRVAAAAGARVAEIVARVTEPTGAPETSDPVPDVPPSSAEPPTAAPTVVEASTGSEPPRPRAKVTRTSTDDVVITLRAPGITTPQVAAIVSDLLAALRGTQTSGVVAGPVERPSTVSTTPDAHVAPAPGKGKPDAGATTTPTTSGRPAPRRAISDDLAAQLAQGYTDGATIAELAKHYQLGRGTVTAALHRSGVPMRPQGCRTESTHVSNLGAAARAADTSKNDRMAALGVTPAEIKRWAYDQGLTDTPTAPGRVQQRLVDAYEHHLTHNNPSTTTTGDTPR